MNRATHIKYALVIMFAFIIGAIFGWFKTNQAYQSNAIFRASKLAFELNALRNDKVEKVIPLKNNELDSELGNYALFIYSKSNEDPFYFSSLKNDFIFTFFEYPKIDNENLNSAISSVVTYKKKYPNSYKHPFDCSDKNSINGQFSCDLANSWALANQYAKQFINEHQ